MPTNPKRMIKANFRGVHSQAAFTRIHYDLRRAA